MKKWMIILLVTALMLPGAAMGEERTYQNPMTVPGQHAPINSGTTDDYGIGDPFIMRYNGRYYLYPSSCEERVRVFESVNLIDWEYKGYCTVHDDVYFAYAPEVVYWQGDFYMVTSPSGNGHYILKSESPLGPFLPVTGNFGYSIDGSFFVKDDGQLLLLFPNGQSIHQTELDEKTMLPIGGKINTGATLKHWTEGPGLFRRGEWYYLTFTGNHVCSTGYQVAWASKKGGPLGNFNQNADSTLLINSVFGDDFHGLGHSSNFIGPDMDSYYTAYHNLVSLAGPARRYNLDRLFTNGGLLYTTGPTNFSMPLPNMPDVYGWMDGDKGHFAENEQGYFASVPAASRFTQECNFALTGGMAIWQLGEKDEKTVQLITDGNTLTLMQGDQQLASVKVPVLGQPGRNHTLRIECTDEIFYAYIDSMRLITLKNPGFTAKEIGALKGEGVSYSFLGCTAQALGSSDDLAVKAIPGSFQAVHALNRGEMEEMIVGKQEEKALLMTRAAYPVQVGAEGLYCFDFTVSPQDAGKRITLYLDGEALMETIIPAYTGKRKADLFTFTTAPVSLTQGSHTLEIAAEGALMKEITAFLFQETVAFDSDFTKKAFRQTYLTYGNFSQTNTKGILKNKANKSGFALFGQEGNTDYEMYVRFEIPANGLGNSGIILRVTDLSWYDAQVEESFFGYSLSLSKIGLNVRRIRYGAAGNTDFVSVPAWKDAKEGELIIRAQGSRITISLPDGKELLSFEDADPFTHGKFGFFSTGKELTVLELNVKPL